MSADLISVERISSCCPAVPHHPLTKPKVVRGRKRPNTIVAPILAVGLMGICLTLVTGCSSPKQEPDTSLREAIGSNSSPNPTTDLPWLRDQTETWQVKHTYDSGFQDEFLFPEIVGGGGALLDMDNDGDLDLYVVQAGNLKSGDFGENGLFENTGNAFRKVADSGDANLPGYGMGAIAGDFDNDGLVDLFVSNVGSNRLLKNLGNGRFKDVTQTAGLASDQWSTSAAFLDADRDGDLDLYVCNYVQWSLEQNLDCRGVNGQADYCSPKSYQKPTIDYFYLNQGDGTFQDATAESGVIQSNGNGLGVVVFDYNNDGYPDLYVANDMTENLLWENQGDATFKNVARQVGCAVDRDGMFKAGMGLAVADIDANGWWDVLVVNMVGQSDSLYLNENGRFRDGTIAFGLGHHSRRFTRFGVGFHDWDNDQDLDLFHANGKVILANSTPYPDLYAEPNLLLENVDGSFRNLTSSRSGLTDAQTTRAAIFGDLDNNGSVEIILINRDAPLQILSSRPNDQAWIGLDVRNSRGAIALGAIVSLEAVGSDLTQRRLVSPYYSYLASNDPRCQFGLGTHQQPVKVQIRWADGSQESFGPLDQDRYHLVKQGEGESVGIPTTKTSFDGSGPVSGTDR